MSKTKIVLFRAACTLPGGMEKIMLEEAEYLEKCGIETHTLAFEFDGKVLFGGTYQRKIEVLSVISSREGRFSRVMPRVFALRNRLRQLRPDGVIAYSSEDAMYLYLATMMTPYSYVMHIPQAVSRGYGGQRRNALIYRKALKKIIESVNGLGKYVPLTPFQGGMTERIAIEMLASMEYLAVRKASKIFVFSKQMKWEVKQLYGKEATVAKGAFPSELLDYVPVQDVRRKLGLDGCPVVLTISRLETQKRIDLILRAFSRLVKKFDNAALVIGGTGPEAANLEKLAAELGISERVIFAGFISESELWDYYAACDVFVCAHWADFNITPYGALALQKKVIWPVDLEVDDNLDGNRHIFAADLDPESYARAINRALTTEVTEKNDLSMYTWDSFSETVLRNLEL